MPFAIRIVDFGLIWAAGTAIGLILGINRLREAIRKDLAIPYVPPLSKQIAALPAEEILLRGSESASPMSEELLRPANTSTLPGELLRATSGTPGRR